MPRVLACPTRSIQNWESGANKVPFSIKRLVEETYLKNNPDVNISDKKKEEVNFKDTLKKLFDQV